MARFSVAWIRHSSLTTTFEQKAMDCVDHAVILTICLLSAAFKLLKPDSQVYLTALFHAST